MLVCILRKTLQIVKLIKKTFFSNLEKKRLFQSVAPAARMFDECIDEDLVLREVSAALERESQAK